MVDKEQLPVDESEFESALASLQPLPSTLDRDRLMYLAGRASAEQTATFNRTGRWLWPSATAIMTVVAGLMAALLIVEPRPIVVQKIPVIGHDPGKHDGNKLSRSDVNHRTGRQNIGAVNPKNDPDADPLGPAFQQLLQEFWLKNDVTLTTAKSSEPSAGTNLPASVWELRQRIIVAGIDALPDPRPLTSSTRPEPLRGQRELLQEMLKNEFPSKQRRHVRAQEL